MTPELAVNCCDCLELMLIVKLQEDIPPVKILNETIFGRLRVIYDDNSNVRELKNTSLKVI